MFKRPSLSTMQSDYNALRSLLEKEVKSQVRPSLGQRLTMWQNGFLSEASLIYDFKKNSPADYLSDYARYIRTPRINGRYASYLNDKLIFHDIVKNFAPVPRVFGTIVAGRYIPLEGDMVDRPGRDDALETLARLHGALVVKPRGGGGGSRISIIRFEPSTGIIFNGELVPFDKIAISQFKHTDYIVTEFIKQAEYAKRIYPAATNTIRLLTMVEPETRKPFIPIAIHSFGSDDSRPVDNWTAGGLSSRINLETGELGPAAAYPSSGVVRYHHTHPDTGEKISGVAVPRWDKLRGHMLHLAKVLLFLPYVGWDIIVSDDGFSIIEGNSYPGVNKLQVHQPLLKDPRVRNFYRHHGVIRS